MSDCKSNIEASIAADSHKLVWLDVFLLCHNRPDGARAAIASILAQSEDGYRLIVSDNSSDDRVVRMMAEDFPSVMLIERGNLPSHKHFSLCIAEARSEYFCLFHDDDTMAPNFVGQMRQAVLQHPDAIAIGANAWEVNHARGTREPFIKLLGAYETIASPAALLRRYFSPHHIGFAPFPGYVYRTNPVGRIPLPTAGGKYADVNWLLSIVARGRMVWLREPLMEYNLHGGNDALQESRKARLSFLAYIKCHPEYAGQSEFADLRHFIYRKLLIYGGGRIKKSKRARMLHKYILIENLRRWLRPVNYKAWAIKVATRLLASRIS